VFCEIFGKKQQLLKGLNDVMLIKILTKKCGFARFFQSLTTVIQRIDQLFINNHQQLPAICRNTFAASVRTGKQQTATAVLVIHT